jgi:hypothetical protein
MLITRPFMLLGKVGDNLPALILSTAARLFMLVSVDGCSLPSIISHRLSFLKADHGIRFISRPLIRTLGRLRVSAG